MEEGSRAPDKDPAYSAFITFEGAVLMLLMFVDERRMPDAPPPEDLQERAHCAYTLFTVLIKAFGEDKKEFREEVVLNYRSRSPYWDACATYRDHLIGRINRALELKDQRLTPAKLLEQLQAGRMIVRGYLPIGSDF